MKNGCFRIISLIILLVLIITGCTVDNNHGAGKSADTAVRENEDSIVLRVLVEKGRKNVDIFYQQVQNVAGQFEEEHANVRIVVEELPEDVESRTSALEMYRVEMLAGKGPDVLLLPSQAQTDTSYKNMLEQLIPDINAAMRNGLFEDISAYYDADDGLDKESLHQAVMNAGVVDGARYVLPLKFSFPAVFYNEERLTEAGLSEEVLAGGVVELMDAITQLGDSDLAGNAWIRHLKWTVLDFFPELLDYDNQEVLVTKDRVVDFMDSYQALWAIIIQGNAPVSVSANIRNFVNGYGYWGTDEHCLQVAKMDTAVCQAALAKANGMELEMLPLTGNDGKLVAEVTMYGVLCSGCKNPEIGYEFLREFLLEPTQWEQNVTSKATLGSGEGYPVRVVGSAEQMYNSIYQREMPNNVTDKEVKERCALLKHVVITDEDIPLLQAEIDEVRFPISDLERELANMVELELNDFGTGAPLDVDIDAMAQTFIDDLKWHLFEG